MTRKTKYVIMYRALTTRNFFRYYLKGESDNYFFTHDKGRAYHFETQAEALFIYGTFSPVVIEKYDPVIDTIEVLV